MPQCNHRRRGRGERPHVAHEKKNAPPPAPVQGPPPAGPLDNRRPRRESAIVGLSPPALPPTCSQANGLLGRFPELRASLGRRATASLCSRGDSKAASGQSEQTRMPHTTRLEK